MGLKTKLRMLEDDVDLESPFLADQCAQALLDHQTRFFVVFFNDHSPTFI